MIEQDPRITQGPTFFQSLYAWMKRVAVELNAKAPLNSPTLTGDPKAPTPANSDNDTSIATTAWVNSAMATIATVAGFAVSLGAAGYIKFPSWLGGLIVQWGSTSTTTDLGGNVVISFPLAFPANVYSVISSNGNGVAVANGLMTAYVTGFPTLTQHAVHVVTSTSGASITSTAVRVNWVAFGS